MAFLNYFKWRLQINGSIGFKAILLSSGVGKDSKAL